MNQAQSTEKGSGNRAEEGTVSRTTNNYCIILKYNNGDNILIVISNNNKKVININNNNSILLTSIHSPYKINKNKNGANSY